MRTLGCATHHWDPITLHLLVRLLDPETREAWEVKLGSTTAWPTFAQFEEFLVGRARALENLSLHTLVFTPQKEHLTGSTNKSRNKVAAHIATPSTISDQSVCPLCGSSHYLAKCERYRTKTLQQKRDVIQKQRRCFNCLGPYTASKCNSTKRCLKCGKKHHTSIHESNVHPSKNTTQTLAKSAATSTKENLKPQTNM